MPPATRKPGRPQDQTLIARRKDEILDVATRVFAEQGYRQTDVQVVADMLNVGKGTVYRYFSTKEDLFLGAVDRGMRRLINRMDAATAAVDDPLDQIAAAVRTYLAFFDQHGELIELLIQERGEFKDRKKPTYFVYRDANLGRWRDLYRKLMAEGRVRQMPVTQILDVMGDLLYGAIFTSHFAGRRKSFEKQAKEILDVVFHGILNEDAADAGRPGPAAAHGRRRKDAP